MTCKEVQEGMPDLALGLSPVPGEVGAHLRSCSACAAQLAEMRATMALLDEWQAPEPSPYFDVRLAARLREEKAQAPGGSWLAWIRRPALALAATAALAIGVVVYRGTQAGPDLPAPVGSAVGDLQQLDKNHDLYSNADTDLLDDLELQDSTANP